MPGVVRTSGCDIRMELVRLMVYLVFHAAAGNQVEVVYYIEDCHAITGRVESHIQPATLFVPKQVDFNLIQLQKLVTDEPWSAAEIPYVHTGRDALGNIVRLIVQIVHPAPLRATAAGKWIAKRAGWADLLVG